MKSALALLLPSIFATGILAAQDPTDVTFAVDMSGVAEFDAPTDTLRIAGSLQADPFTPRDPSNVNIMTDPDGDSIYNVTLPVVTRTIQFKYVINAYDDDSLAPGNSEFTSATPGNGEGCTEGSGNRIEAIPLDLATYAIPTYRYNTCDTLTTSSVRSLRELRGVRVGPNPMREYATLSLPARSGGAYRIRLLRPDGRLVRREETCTGPSYDIRRGSLASGIYLVEVVDASTSERAVLRLSVE